MRPARTIVTRARLVDRRRVDLAVAVALAIAFILGEASSSDPSPVALIAGVALAATVAWRRRAPAAALAVAGVSALLFNRTGGMPNFVVTPIPIMLGWHMLGLRSGERGRWTATEPILLAAAVPTIAVTPGDGQPVAVVAVWGLFMVFPFAAGRALGTHRALAGTLRMQVDQLASEQSQRASRAAAGERTRIARELHDVVAHNVSVMVIQNQAALRVIGQDRDGARQALQVVESCGRDALADMRRMIGVLRRDDTELTVTGVDRLHVLAERARASGLPVELQICGAPRCLSPALELVVFRVVQEALTNSIKHAAPTRARVRVAFGADAVELDISDDGHGRPPSRDRPHTGGHGLVGMRERLALFGAVLDAGPLPGGGFGVRARIPLAAVVSA